MKKKNVVLVLLVATACLVFGFSKEEREGVGRYQLVFGTVDAELTPSEKTNVCFKIDTETGEVWRYVTFDVVTGKTDTGKDISERLECFKSIDNQPMAKRSWQPLMPTSQKTNK